MAKATLKSMEELTGLKFGTKRKSNDVNAILKQNAKSRARIASAGEEDPTKKTTPSALERIFGPLDVLGTGVRGLVHNVIDDNEDVDIIAEMGKSLKGEKRIEGADILSDLGVQDKWGKMLGGIALDILLDPVTYISWGYSAAAKNAGKTAITAAAKSGGLALDDIARFAGREADDIVMPFARALAAKSGDEAAEIAAKLLSGDMKVALGMLDDATANAVRSGLMRKAAAELGESGGLKFMGKTVVPVQGTLDKGYAKIADTILGTKPGRWAQQAFSAYGDKIPEGANALERIFIPREIKDASGVIARGRAIGGKMRSLIEKQLPDDVNRNLFTIGVGREFGDVEVRRGLDKMFQAVKAAKNDYYTKMVEYARELGLHGWNSKPSIKTVEGFADQIPARLRQPLEEAVTVAEDALRQAVAKAYDPEGIVKTFIEAGADDTTIARVKELVPQYHALMDEMEQLRRSAGLPSWTLYGDYLPEGAPRSAGYAPGYRPRISTNLLNAPDKEGRKALGAQTEAFDRLGLKIGEEQAPLAAENLAEVGMKPMTGSGKVQLAPKAMKSKVYKDAERAMLDGGLLNELDVAKLAEAKVAREYTDIAAKGLADNLAASGMDAEKAAEMRRLFLGVFNEDQATQGFIRTFDTAQNLWKKAATSMRFPAFQNRNLLNNKILQAIKGVLDLESEAKAVRLIERLELGKIVMGTKEYDDVLELVQRGILQSPEEFAQLVRGGAFRSIPGKFFGEVNSAFENQSRVAAYFAGLKRGLDADSAARLVDEALYDYSNVARTAFERSFMMRIVPFYKWMRQNTPNMLETLIKDPGKLSWLGHVKESGEAVTEYDESVMPKWIRDLYPIPTPATDKNGNPIFISTAGLFPQGELEILSGVLGGKFDPKDAFGALSPIIRTPLEILFNKDLWYDSEIEKYPGEKKRVPTFVEEAADAMDGVPGLEDVWRFVAQRLGVEEREIDGEFYWVAPAQALKVFRDMTPWLNNVSKVLADQPRTPYDRIAALTGVNPILYEQERFAQNQAYENRATLQDVIRRLKDEGKIPEEAPKRASLADLFGR